MQKIGLLLICTFALGLAPAVASARDTSGLFDAPADEKHLPLAPNPLNPQAKPELSCFYYRDFLVKQIDRGEKGAEQLSILAFAAGSAKPECKEGNAASEYILDNKEWGGYFRGAKGSYVFFDADDGQNGGIGFAIFNAADGKRLFDDTALDFHSIQTTATGIVMRYKRVYSLPCSLVSEPASCWGKITQAVNLDTMPPDCTASYKAEQIRSGMKAEELAPDPSVLDYEAETTLEGGQTKTARVGGDVVCRPAN